MTENHGLPSAAIAPAHGGSLRELLVGDGQREALRREAVELASWDLTQRQVCDIELLINGGFSPLDGFMGRADYDRVCQEMRLSNGTLWPMPITLDVSQEFAEGLKPGQRVALRHPEGMVIAIMSIGDVWEPDRRNEAALVFGTEDDAHPGVFSLFESSNPVYVGGPLEGVELPPQHTFNEIRFTPAELRHRFAKRGWSKVVAFQTRNPMHRAHIELTRRAAEQIDGNLLIHPVVGMTKPGDVDYFVRVRAYEHILHRYPSDSTDLSLLPLAMRMGGPREALWHAIIRKNHGCSHFIVGRDHAGVGNYYSAYAAHEIFEQYPDLGIVPLFFTAFFSCKRCGSVVNEKTCPHQVDDQFNFSGTKLRDSILLGSREASRFVRPEVAEAVRSFNNPFIE